MNYREIEQLLIDLEELRDCIDLKKAPDYSTLCKAEKRLLDSTTTRELLQETIREALSRNQMKELIELAAMDGSGFESRHISEHYLKRQNMTRKRIPHKKHPKMSILVDTDSHMILGVKTGRGPKPDILDFENLVEGVSKDVKIKTLLGDKGYDSEAAHVLAREGFGINLIVPPRVAWKTKNLPSTLYRRLAAIQLPSTPYGQRWQVETVFSMIKRLLRSSLTARSYFSQNRELRLRALTFNIMLIRLFFR